MAVGIDLGIRCLSCGVLSVREARFCRQCGAVLRADGLRDAIDGAAPDAPTVEFNDPRRHTSPLAMAVTSEEINSAKRQTSELGEIEPPISRAAALPVPKRRSRAAFASFVVLAIAGSLTLLFVRQHNATTSLARSWIIPAFVEPITLPAVPPVSVASVDEHNRVKVQTAGVPAVKGRSQTHAGPRMAALDQTTINQADQKPASPTTVARNDPPAMPVAIAPSKKPVTNAPLVRNDSVDAYQRGLNIVHGRSVVKLSRAELLEAMQVFQNVKLGPNKGLANRQVDQLGREIDRRTWKH